MIVHVPADIAGQLTWGHKQQRAESAKVVLSLVRSRARVHLGPPEQDELEKLAFAEGADRLGVED